MNESLPEYELNGGEMDPSSKQLPFLGRLLVFTKYTCIV